MWQLCPCAALGGRGQLSWGLSSWTQRKGTAATDRALETRTLGFQPHFLPGVPPQLRHSLCPRGGRGSPGRSPSLTPTHPLELSYVSRKPRASRRPKGAFLVTGIRGDPSQAVPVCLLSLPEPGTAVELLTHCPLSPSDFPAPRRAAPRTTSSCRAGLPTPPGTLLGRPWPLVRPPAGHFFLVTHGKFCRETGGEVSGLDNVIEQLDT